MTDTLYSRIWGIVGEKVGYGIDCDVLTDALFVIFNEERKKGRPYSGPLRDDAEHERRLREALPTPDTESLRSALRECGRAAGAFISDECSDEFLLQVPAEVRLAFAKPVWADIHYAWELHDADGEWQAGGSANNLEDVQREGSRYLQTYAQDGPHKLIIQRHCVNTINEVTP